MLSKLKNAIRNQAEENHLVNSLFLATVILLFHVMLIAAIGVMVLLLHGLMNYMVWILLAGFLLAAGSVYLFFRYMNRTGGKALQKMLSLPEIKGKNIEIRFLGGIASLKIRNEMEDKAKIGSNVISSPLQIEDTQTACVRELAALATLLEKNLITDDEYHQAKKVLFHQCIKK
jgi:hypothetical protein